MQQITEDLWETTADAPFPGLTTHAYLWAHPTEGNVLFYSVASDRDLERMAELGGVARQYLSHQDEASSMLVEIGRRFDAPLHAPGAEHDAIAEFRVPDELFAAHTVDDLGVEVIPAPGHSPGSTCFVVHGVAGTYLFTGDTLYVGRDGRWAAGFVPGVSDADDLVATVRRLGDLQPDLVISSAFTGSRGAHRVDPATWSASAAAAADALEASRSGAAAAPGG